MDATQQVLEDDVGLVLSVRDYVDILKRRRWWFFAPFLGALVLALAAMILLPVTYESMATILIEEQEVPREFVTSTVTSFAAQRIQVINRRILTSESITGIAQELDLFLDPETGRLPPSTQLAERFREHMTLELVSSDVIDPRSGRPTKATIAFTLSFRHSNATKAQMVNNELVTRFLDENLRARSERAASTEEFLANEAAHLNDELVAQESRIAEFKEQNHTALPELNEYNRSSLDRATRELSDLELRLRELSSRDLELSSTIAQVPPYATVVLEDGQVVLSDYDRLKGLRAEHRRLGAIYYPAHPEMIALGREIARLEQALALKPGESVNVPAEPDNPTYLLLDTQRKVVRAEIGSVIERQRELKLEIVRLEGVLARAPEIEKQYQALLRDYAAGKARYQELRAKQREASLAEDLEQERKGERFVLLEPPSLPLQPVSPNRPVLALIGLVAGIGFGLIGVMGSEAMDNTIHGEKQLATLTGAPPFAVVGYIDNSDDLLRGWLIRRRLLVGAAAASLMLLAGAHFLLAPADTVWLGLLSRLGL